MCCVYTPHTCVLCIYTTHMCFVYVHNTRVRCVYAQHTWVLSANTTHMCVVHIHNHLSVHPSIKHLCTEMLFRISELSLTLKRRLWEREVPPTCHCFTAAVDEAARRYHVAVLDTKKQKLFIDVNVEFPYKCQCYVLSFQLQAKSHFNVKGK